MSGLYPSKRPCSTYDAKKDAREQNVVLRWPTAEMSDDEIWSVRSSTSCLCNIASKMVWRTNLITVSICFLLGGSISRNELKAGTTFTHWIADHNVLWRTPITEEALLTSISYYSLLSSAPHGLGWAYIVVGMVALLSTAGRAFKVLGTGRGEVVFDGGSVGK
jgi:hypothetical protein